jgi:hypothetical protein
MSASNHKFKRVILFRCQRCSAVFAITEIDEKYGPTQKIDLLENNPCEACGKGSIEVLGKFLLEVDE